MASDAVAAVDLPDAKLEPTAFASTERPGQRARLLENTGWYLLLLALAVVVLFPVYMTLVRAVSTPVKYIAAGLPFHPVDFQPGAFKDAFVEGDLGSRMWLSAQVTFIITAAQLVTSVLAAYAFSFLRFPLKRLIFVLFMAT